MHLVETTCKKCGADLEVDLDRLQAFCPYCGSKLKIDMKHMDRVLSAKEKTKRAKMYNERMGQRDYYEYKTHETRNAMLKTFLGMIIPFLLLLLLGMLMKANLL